MMWQHDAWHWAECSERSMPVGCVRTALMWLRHTLSVACRVRRAHVPPNNVEYARAHTFRPQAEQKVKVKAQADVIRCPIVLDDA